MRRIAVVILLFPLFVFAQKQSFEQYKAEQQAKFAKYKSDKQKEFDAYRQKLNADYAAYMAKQWKVYKSYAAEKKPMDQDIPKPEVKEGCTPPPNTEIRYRLVITIVPYEAPMPVVPFDTPPTEDKPSYSFSFHGTPCKVHLSNALKYTLPNATEQSAAGMWTHLSDPVYDAFVSDCLRLRDELQLNDWGYINLLQALTKSFYGNDSNEAILTQMYVLTQSGYSSRIASIDDKWVLLVPLQETMYSYSYIYLDNQKYYILAPKGYSCSYKVFDRAFPEEKIASLRMNASPKLTYRAASSRTLSSRRYPGIRASVIGNLNLIDFYNEYPLSSKWDYYSAASLSDETKQSLYPVFKREIAGKSASVAANMLINFVQTAFDYKTDGDQFGYERPLFGDETLFYPYSDCEDRSILYSILVRELLGLDVVLLDYPDHIATAVNFPNDKTYGYYFILGNKKYTICDPTYIGADIGECMPRYEDVSPKIIRIQ